MPRLPIDYSKTIIYKIVCNDLNICDVYVGSTTDFIRRKQQHKTNCNNEKSKKYNLKVYQYIRQNGDWDNFSMIEIEKYPCNDSNEARTRERHYFELLNAKLNSILPNRTKEDIKDYNKDYNKKYKEQNKEKIAEKAKHYREKNKEKIIEKAKQYREKNAEKAKQYAKQYREVNNEKIIEQQKEYYEDNKEKIAEKAKQYRENNKEKIKKQRKQYRESKKQKSTKYHILLK